LAVATPLSPKTRQHLETLFAPAERAAAERALLEWVEGSSERLRFAVLRLSGGDLAALAHAVSAGEKDWRDVLVWADFGDGRAHETWVPRRFTPQQLARWLAGGDVDDVNFGPGDLVQLRSAWALGPRGRIKSLDALEPEPTYTVTLETGSEVRVPQFRLQRAILIRR
jgi:hypothetical protein